MKSISSVLGILLLFGGIFGAIVGYFIVDGTNKDQDRYEEAYPFVTEEETEEYEESQSAEKQNVAS